MKKCPFCAEEIQPEAIKCRFCNSWLTADGAGGAAGASGKGEPAGAEALKPKPAVDTRPRHLFEGVPSWKAFFRGYAITALAGLLLPVIGYWIADRAEGYTLIRVLVVIVPLVVAALVFFGMTLYRKSIRYRITSANVEMEYGILSKRIDNLELWRCRDIRYDQSLLDRILRISTICIFTADVTSPEVKLVGMPASRQLFEHIRDSIEIQRQARNVIGMVQ